MRELKADEQVVVLAVGLEMSLAGRAHQSSQRRDVGRIDQKLTGIGPAFGDDRAGLPPDQLGPAGAEAAVAAEGQLARRAIGLPVAAFHRLNRQPVANPAASDIQRLQKRREIGAQFHSQAKCSGRGEEILTRLVPEIA